MYDPDQYYLAAEDVAGNLRYNQNVTVTAGPADDKKTYTGEDLLARAFCHEIDHLHGTLYVSKAEGGIHDVARGDEE